MASNEWLVRKLLEQDKKIEALSRGGTGVGHTSLAANESLTVSTDDGEVVLKDGGLDYVSGVVPPVPTAPSLKLGFGTIEVTWDGGFGEDEDGIPIAAPLDLAFIEVHASTDPEEENWGDDTLKTQVKAKDGFTVTTGGYDVDDEVYVCLIAVSEVPLRSEPSATASLVIEGLDFSALFNELDAANATIKNAGEVLVTEQGTLDEKLSEVDGTLNDLGQDLQAVEDAQAQLNTDLSDVMTSVDGKNTITWNPSAPSKVSNPGKAVGDMWYRTSGNSIIGFWKWDGTDWVTQLLDKTTIPLIDIGAGTFGSLNGSRLEVGSVTADKVLVGSGTNLIADGGFVAPFGQSWQVASGTSDSWRIERPTNGTNYLVGKQIGSGWKSAASFPGVRVSAGEQYSVSADFRTPTIWPSGYPRIEVYVYDGDGVRIQAGSVANAVTNTTAWQSVSGSLTVPAGGVSMNFVAVLHSTTADGSEFYVRNPTFRLKTGATLIEDGAVSTQKLSADVLEVKNLKATTGQLNEAVINKLFSDVVVAKTAVANAFIGENAILTGAVTAPKITASEELWAKIAEFVKIRAEHIEADAIDGMVITGATIRSAATGARTLMSATGFEAYDNTGKRTFFASASTGNVSMTGELYTGDPGSERVVLDNSLWRSVEVTDPETGMQAIVPGAGVRIGVSSFSGVDIYHAATTSAAGRYVDQAVVRGPAGRSRTVYGAVSAGNGLPGSNYVNSTAYDNSGKVAAQVLATAGGTLGETRKAELAGRNTDGDYRALVQAIGSTNMARMLSLDTDGVPSALVAADGAARIAWISGKNASGTTNAIFAADGSTGRTQIGGASINPVFVDYMGTGPDWIVPFRKDGADWGYVGSSGAMGVDDFGIQSAAGKNLVLRGDGDILHYGNRHWANYNSTTGTANIRMTTNGFLGVVSSSQRYKDAIEPATETVSGLVEKILSVDARTWFDKNSAERLSKSLTEECAGQEPTDDLKDVEPLRRIPGVIAEEMHDAGLGILVEYNDNGLPESVMYDRLGAMLLPVVRDLHDRITELERQTHE